MITVVCAILGAIGATLGVVNTIWNWRDKKERLSLYWASRELLIVRIYNPTPRPVEIRSRVFEIWDKDKTQWAQDPEQTIGRAPGSVIEPFRSEEIQMGASEAFDIGFGWRCRIRVTAGSGREYVEEIKKT